MTYYLTLFVISFIMTCVYVFQWHKHFDVNMTVVYPLIPLANLAYVKRAASVSPDAVINAQKVIYVSGCFLPWFSAMCIAGLCKISVSRSVRLLSFLVTSAMLASVLSIGYSGIYYKSFSVEPVDGMMIIHREYGPMHTAFYVMVVLYLIADVVMIVYSLYRKKQVSRRILALLSIPVITSILGYFANHLIDKSGYEIMPVTYLLAQLTYLFIARRMTLYDVSEMVIESMVQKGDTGFISLDFGGHYLGSNERAREIIPALSELAVDLPIDRSETFNGRASEWLEHFKTDDGPVDGTFVWQDPKGEAEDRVYKVDVNYLYDGSMRRGYQIFLQDDTQNQKYISLIDKYNTELQAEVAAKTERLVDMHNNLILSMATMVESRDNTTGGHIRRTSEGVRLLIAEMQKDGALGLSDSFCRNLIKAAPMHDLGKIAVDDAVLRKPGRYTPEEYDKMKTHAAEGARIVHEILKGTDDLEFHLIAENVAHYHHERYDGSGYPEGLKGEEIPLEARIMAIADVYDALVSRRPYKEPFSFERADGIITEGMGSQFDPALRKYYEAARPALEAFYLSSE